MAHFNKVILLGEVANLPELRRSAHGRAYTILELSGKETRLLNTGDIEEREQIFEGIAFDELAREIVETTLRHMEVLVEGYLKYRSVISPKTGRKRSTVEMIIEKFIIFSSPIDHLNKEDEEFLSKLPPGLRKLSGSGKEEASGK